MEYLNPREHEALKMAEYITPPITITDTATHKHYTFCKYLWLGNWGICNADKTRIIIRAQKTYSYAEILVATQLIIAGNPRSGWDVYFPDGIFCEHLPPMFLKKAKNLLGEKKRK